MPNSNAVASNAMLWERVLSLLVVGASVLGGGRVPRPRFAAGGLDRPSAARRLARSAGNVMEAIGLHRSRTRSVGVCWRADRDEPKVSTCAQTIAEEGNAAVL